MRSQTNQMTNQTSVTFPPPSRVFSRPLTVVGLLRVLLGAVLLVAAAAKLRAGASARGALRSYGIESARARAALWAAAISFEAALGAALAVGAPGAAAAAAGLMGLFALALVAAIASGRAGKPCGCFGARSRIGWPAVARTALLAAALAALPFMPERHLSTDAWLAAGLV